MIAATWLMISTLLYSLQLNTGSFPKPLPPQEERKYLQLAQAGDLEARNILIEHNLRLVAHVMKKGRCTQELSVEDNWGIYVFLLRKKCDHSLDDLLYSVNLISEFIQTNPTTSRVPDGMWWDPLISLWVGRGHFRRSLGRGSVRFCHG